MPKKAKLSPRIVKLLRFLREIEQLQRVKRAILYTDGSPENTAEHSWHLGMFVMLLAKEIDPKANLEHMLKMALIHDLVEIYAGDTPVFGDTSHQATQAAREEEAAEKLFAQLPVDLEKEFWTLFREFAAKTTAEAKVVASLDHLQPIMQNLIHNGTSWKEQRMTAQRHDDRKRLGLHDDEIVIAIYESFHLEAVERRLFVDD